MKYNGMLMKLSYVERKLAGKGRNLPYHRVTQGWNAALV